MQCRKYHCFMELEQRCITMTIIEKEVFRPLKDIHVFLDTCTVLNNTLAWDINRNRDNTTCLDIDPDVLYELPVVEEKIV